MTKGNNRRQRNPIIQVTVDPDLYKQIEIAQKKGMYLSMADVLREAFRRQFLEGRSSSGKDKEEVE